MGSEQDNSFLLPQDDNSNDALVIVDDDSNWSLNDNNTGRNNINLLEKMKWTV